MPEGEPVIRFVRLRLGDGTPLAVETNYVPEQLVPGMTEDDLAGSWYARLADHYDIHIISGMANVEAAMPDERTAALLGITMAQPCFRVGTVVRDRSGRVVDTASRSTGATTSRSPSSCCPNRAGSARAGPSPHRLTRTDLPGGTDVPSSPTRGRRGHRDRRPLLTACGSAPAGSSSAVRPPANPSR